MTPTLTLKKLCQWGACGEALKVFIETWGEDAEITAEQALRKLRALRRPRWEGWLLAQEPSFTKALLAAGADVSAYCDFALADASAKGHLRVARMLLAAGADVHARNGAALYWARFYHHDSVIKMLEKAGAENG